MLSGKAPARNMICSKKPLFFLPILFKKYNPEYLNMLSICCGLVPACVFGNGFCGWQTDKLERERERKKRGEKQSILVLDSRAVVRNQLQEAGSPSSNELGLFFLLLGSFLLPIWWCLWEAVFFFLPLLLFFFSPSQSKITWDVIN